MNQSSLLQTGVWVIPIFIIATIVALFFLVRYWRSKSIQELKNLRGELRKIQTYCRQLEKTSQELSDADQEPYRSLIEALGSLLDKINQQLTDLEVAYVTIQDSIRNTASNPWQSIIRAPFFWYLMGREIEDLQQGLSTAATSLSAAQATEKKLTQIGWEIALQARHAQGMDQQVRVLLDELLSRNVYGDSIEVALQQDGSISEALNQIPAYFFSADEQTILEQADTHNIALTHNILEDATPKLEELLNQAQTWKGQYTEALKKVTRMRRVLGGVEGSLTGMPPAVNLESYYKRLEGLHIISENLHATLSRLEAESMSSIIEEAERVQAAVHEMDGALVKARQQAPALDLTLNDLNEGMNLLSAQFAALATSRVHPVIWNHSQPQLTNLSRQVNTLGPINQVRTVEQLERDLTIATGLNDERNELAMYCQGKAQEHAELLRILESPEFKQGKEWLQQTELLLERVNYYSPENWPRSDGVTSLPNDLAYLEDDMYRLVFEAPEEPIHEGELSQRLNETRELMLYYKTLGTRISHIQTRLSEIQETEVQSSEHLKVADSSLSQISFLVGSNQFLKSAAGSELKRLQDELKRQSEELDQPGRGSVDRKAKNAVSINAKIESSTINWANQLSKDTLTQTTALSTTLSSLDEIANIDEQTILSARHLLSTSNIYSSPIQKSKLTTTELVQELKHRSDYWQSCTATRRAVEDIEQPVKETYVEASQARQYVQDYYADLSKRGQKPHHWPPTTVSLDIEKKELDGLEKQWKSLHSEPTKAIGLVHRLGNLTSRYNALADKIQRSNERLDHDQQQIEELEIALNDYEQRWKDLRHAHRDSPQANQEIKDLLNSIDRDLKEIKGDYRKGRIDYQDVSESLKMLQQRARLAQIPLDENTAVDINGRLITSR